MGGVIIYGAFVINIDVTIKISELEHVLMFITTR